MDQIRSEGGSGKFSAVLGTGALSTGITKTDLLTTGMTLGSAGMEFVLKEVVLCAGINKKAGVLGLYDGASCSAGTFKLGVALTTISVAGGQACVQVKDLHGVRFSSAVRYKVSTAGLTFHVGGLRLVLQV